MAPRTQTVVDRDRTAEHARGRDADAPREIPPAGWRDVGMRVKKEAKDDNVTLISAGVAFFALLALTPGLAAAVSIYGLVSSPSQVARRVDQLASTFPTDVRHVLSTQLRQIVQTRHSALGLTAIVGIAIALWSASTAMSHLLVALSTIYDEHETRKFLALRSRGLLLTLAAVVFTGICMVLLVIAPEWAASTLGSWSRVAAEILRWPVLALLMVLALAVLYRYAPDGDEPRWRWVSWGSVAATVLWLVVSALFSLYTANFGSYNKTYGSMAAVVVTMLWLWLTAICVLLGAEINAELEHQTTRDSTEGPETEDPRTFVTGAEGTGRATPQI